MMRTCLNGTFTKPTPAQRCKGRVQLLWYPWLPFSLLPGNFLYHSGRFSHCVDVLGLPVKAENASYSGFSRMDTTQGKPAALKAAKTATVIEPSGESL